MLVALGPAVGARSDQPVAPPTAAGPRNGTTACHARMPVRCWEKQKLLTCCLVTTTPNELVQPVHDRMPVIVPPASYCEWLDPDTPVGRLTALLRPYSAEEMQVAEVGPAVNSPRNDGPECLEAA